MKKILIGIGGILVLALIGLGIVFGPTMAKFLKVVTVEVDPQLTVFLGGGGNSLVLKSEDNRTVLIVDTKMRGGSKMIKAYVDRLGKDVKTYVVNTHSHPDHTGGNALFEPATFIAGDYPEAQWKQETGFRNPDEKIAVGATKTLMIGSETVEIFNTGQGHTSNDCVVYLKQRKLLHMGDLLFNQWHPVLAVSHANVGKWIQTLDFLSGHFEIKTVVPGHGALTDRQGLLEMRDYFTSIKAAIGDPAKLALVREKYKTYNALPGMSGFKNTVRYIETEEKNGGNK